MVLDAKNTLNIGLYTAAKGEVASLSDKGLKDELEGELTKVYKEIEAAREEERKKREEEQQKSDGKYSKAEIIAMSEQQVRDMSNEEFILFMASAARLVYNEYGGVLPSITIAQAILESGYGNSFTSTTHNVFGLIGYPGEKPKVGVLRKFDNFYEATDFHASYFENYPKSYTNFLALCDQGNALEACKYLSAYAGGSQTYPSNCQWIINNFGLEKFDEMVGK